MGLFVMRMQLSDSVHVLRDARVMAEGHSAETGEVPHRHRLMPASPNQNQTRNCTAELLGEAYKALVL